MNEINNLSELARRAHMGTSFQPENRGAYYVREYSADLQSLLDEVPEEHHDWVKEKYIKLLSAWWSAKSRCISPAIVGFSKFPTNRAQKFSNWERGHFDAFHNWRDTIAQKLQRKAARQNWTLEGDIKRLESELETLKIRHERMKAANRILNSKKLTDEEKQDEIHNLGFENIPENVVSGKLIFPQYELTSNLAMIKTREARIAELTKRIQAKEQTPNETIRDGVRIVENITDNRLQLFFEGIPPVEVRNTLKNCGFRWSPSAKCWQAYFSAKHKLDRIFETIKPSTL